MRALALIAAAILSISLVQPTFSAPISNESKPMRMQLSEATCTYDGKTYKKGDTVCRAKEKHECGNDGWINLRQKC